MRPPLRREALCFAPSYPRPLRSTAPSSQRRQAPQTAETFDANCLRGVTARTFHPPLEQRAKRYAAAFTEVKDERRWLERCRFGRQSVKKKSRP